MTRPTKILLSVLTLGVLAFGVALVVSWQAKIAMVTASFFGAAECESGSMPRDSDALLKQGSPHLASTARALWGPHGLTARVVTRRDGRFLRVDATYVWPFEREEPLEGNGGDSTP